MEARTYVRKCEYSIYIFDNKYIFNVCSSDENIDLKQEGKIEMNKIYSAKNQLFMNFSNDLNLSRNL